MVADALPMRCRSLRIAHPLLHPKSPATLWTHKIATWPGLGHNPRRYPTDHAPPDEPLMACAVMRGYAVLGVIQITAAYDAVR